MPERSTRQERDVEGLQATVDRLRLEVAELRASRKRLVLAADADRQTIERDLHDGPQQHLTALAVNMQLARGLADADPAAARTLLEELTRDLQDVLDETARLAERVDPPLLESGGLAVALRSAAVRAGVPASVEVAPGAGYPPEIARTVYLWWVGALERAGAGAQATVTVKGKDGGVAFEVTEDRAPSDAELLRLRDRVEALGGHLGVRSEPGDAVRVSATLPRSR
jgi:signal transduction histidine kinase